LNCSVSDVVAYGNNNTGFAFSGRNNTIKNSFFMENGWLDVSISASYATDCYNNMTNITGSGGRQIEYYNYSAVIENKTLAELILCNADYSRLNNITISGSDSLKNNYLKIYSSEYINFSNINSSGNYRGINAEGSRDMIFTNITTNDNDGTGMYLYQAYNITLDNSVSKNNVGNGIFLSASIVTQGNFNLTNVIANNNTYYGIELIGSYIHFDNVTANNNQDSGILLSISGINNTLSDFTSSNNGIGLTFWGAQNNTLVNSTIVNNTLYGIFFEDFAGLYSQGNLIYNNFFNNTINYYSNDTSYINNSFNVTKTLSTNIIGKDYLGGNFWAYPNGTGPS
jgi:hypothetical protein